MLSLEFESKFAAYLCVGSLSILLWDILDNLKNDYRLLFRHRVGLPITIYFLSRFSVLAYIVVTTIFLTTPFISCTAFQAAFIALFIVNLTSTLSLSYIRVCAVWHWNRFIAGFFGISLSAVVASGFALIFSLKTIQVENSCVDKVVGHYILAPFLTSFFNHTVVFLAITYGVCRNTIGRNLTVMDGIRLMFGKSLPTFSKALLHDSQVCYINIMGIAAVTIIWFSAWIKIQPTSPFQLALVPPYSVLVNIMICRVFRNTKLGLYNKPPLPFYDQKSQIRTTPDGGTISWNTRPNTSDGHCNTVIPIQIEVNQVVEYENDLTRSKHRACVDLDFGMA